MSFIYKYNGKKIRYDDKITLHDIDDDFSYKKYLENYAEDYLRSSLEPIDLDNISFHTSDKNEEDEAYESAVCELYSEFSNYANEYEILYQKQGIDPTNDIKELADLYRKVLEMLEAEAQEQKMRNQRIALVTVLKKVCAKKKLEEDVESEERIAAFKAGKINVVDLKFRDLSRFVINKKIIDLQRLLRIKFNDEILKLDYQNMTIKEIITFLGLEGFKR